MSDFVWIDLGDGRSVMRRISDAPAPARSDLATPMVITDLMAPVQSMLDGKTYDSKAALRATYKAAGVVEIGNDPARLRPFQKPPIDRQAIKTTLEVAEARFNRGERVSKTPATTEA